MHSTRSTKTSALVAYVPAVHAGYVKLFKKYRSAHVYILGTSFLKEFIHLERDLRALKPKEAAQAVKSLKITDSVTVLESKDLRNLNKYKKILLPDEDVSRDFAEKYLTGITPRFENIFLRWNKQIMNFEKEPTSARIVSKSAFDREMISRAITEGQKSADWWRQIGAVLVLDKSVALKAHIRYFPSDLALDIFGTPRSSLDAGERPDVYISMHSEADIIAQAAGNGVSLKGASLYVSTFPCINCAFLIARSGIAKVYYSQGYSRLDADTVLKHAGIEIIRVELGD
jgi:dCMP deaminase